MPTGKSVNIDRTIGASVGSKVTSSAMDKASRTAISNRSSQSSTSPNPPPSIRTTPKSAIHPGSAAGLKNAQSIHLTMNNSGYLNPANQTARLKDRTRQIDTSIQNRIVNQTKSNKIFDSRLTCSKTSSISLMEKKSTR